MDEDMSLDMYLEEQYEDRFPYEPDYEVWERNQLALDNDAEFWDDDDEDDGWDLDDAQDEADLRVYDSREYAPPF